MRHARAGAAVPGPGTNGRVGQDAEFIFATPLPGKKCPAKNGAPKRQTKVRFSTDGGATWFIPAAATVGASPASDHAYTYPVTARESR